MRWLQSASWRVLAAVWLCALLGGLTGCGSNTPGRMEWVAPKTTGKPRVGTVYLLRGWKGIFSVGIDQMGKQINEKGVSAYVYMPEQYPELAKAIIERYKNVPDHEPICFIGHSRGSDSALIISRELERAGIAVDLCIILDSVDETNVSKNVKFCYNYFLPGWLGNTNLLRGIPIFPDPGFTGVLVNTNLTTPEAHDVHDALVNHIDIDKGPMLQKRIVEQVLQVCVERSKWRPSAAGAAPTTSPVR